MQQYINSSMDDLSVVYLYTAQPISQPPDVTNNAKSTRQADRVGHYAPAHISSVRMNNSGNISGLQDDGKCLLWKNSFWNCEMVYFLCTGKIKEVCLLFSRNSTSREGLCQDTTVTKYIKGMKIWSRVVCFCCGLLKVWPYAFICLLIHVNCRDQNENH